MTDLEKTLEQMEIMEIFSGTTKELTMKILEQNERILTMNESVLRLLTMPPLVFKEPSV